jgi:hypothetical protein
VEGKDKAAAVDAARDGGQAAWGDRKLPGRAVTASVPIAGTG